MAARNYLESAPHNQIMRYRLVAEDYQETATPFTGAPRRHPYDAHKLLLVPAPVEAPPFFYEFEIADIVHVEELQRIAAVDGGSLQIIKLWVKNSAVGFKLEPFRVGSAYGERRRTNRPALKHFTE